MLSMVYTKLIRLLESYGIECRITAESTRHIANRVICAIWDGEEYAVHRTSAMRMCHEFRYPRRLPSGPNNPTDTPTSTNQPLGASPVIIERAPTHDKTANSMQMRFKNDSDKFTGDPDACWQEYLIEYERAATDHNLTPEQYAQCFPCILSGEARRFYNRMVQNSAAPVEWDDIKILMNAEYNSYHRQCNIKDRLERLRLANFISSECSPRQALKKVANLILRLSPQAPNIYQHPDQQRAYLRCAVLGFSCARHPVAELKTAPISFHRFYERLLGEIHQDEDEAAAIAENPAAPPQLNRLSQYAAITTHFNNRYGQDPTAVRDRNQRHGNKGAPCSSNGGATPRPGFRPKISSDDLGRRCFNCNKEGCYANKCPHPLNLPLIAARKVKFFEQKRPARPHQARLEATRRYC